MDAVGAAASCLALVEAAAKIGSVCVKYAIAVKHSKEDILRLQNEAWNLEQVLKRAQEFYKNSDEEGIQLVDASTKRCLNSCEEQLARILAKLEPTRLSRFGARWRLDQLAWPFRKKEVDELIEDLERYKKNVSTAIEFDQLTILKDIRHDTSSVSLPIAEGASFDSFSDQLNARCHAKTRLALRQRIRDWFQDTGGTSIFWLSGMAGTGKSTVLRSMAQEFQDQHKLAATFFFKRGEGARGNASRFFVTVASQLMYNVPKLGVFIREACKADPLIYDKSMTEQFRYLIKDPMAKYEKNKHSPLLIVIDALDECEGEGDARLVIQLLAEIDPSDKKSIRLLLSSRPEAPIRTTFGKLPDTKYISCILHELSDDIKQDIKIYLKDELSDLHNNPEFDLQDDWPTDTQINTLVTMAEPLFIAAATIVRFISDTKWEPEQQLERMLTYQKVDHFGRLGLVYQPVLDQMLVDLDRSQEQEMLADFQSVVGTIVVLEDALSRAAIAGLLGISMKFIARRLSMLHSVLKVPAEEHLPIRLLHLSFRDYLTGDTQKDHRFWVDQCKTHHKIGQACLQLLMMTPCLKQDICDIRKPAVERKSIKRDLIMAKIPLEVQYASKYWIDHVCKGRGTAFDYSSLHEFLKAKFLYWVEALVLLGHRHEIKAMLESLQANCQDVDNIELKNFLRDAISFISMTGSLLDMFPLQMYSSGLIFTLKSSIIRSTFEHEIPPWTYELPRALDLRNDKSPIHIGHTSTVLKITLSPDEQQLSTGSYDGSIKLWHTDTGRLQFTLQGHENRIDLLAYIRQGAFLLSHSSWDDYVIIWNVKKGYIERTIDIGSSIVTLTLSHNSYLLAVCLYDGTFELWSLITYTREDSTRWQKKPTFARFSSDDTLLALVFGDSIIVITVSNGAQIGVFKGPTLSSSGSEFQQRKLAFSPSNSLLAAAGETVGIWVWSVSKVQLLYKLDPCSEVYNLLFLLDDSRLVSSPLTLREGHVQVWDCIKGTLDTEYPNSIRPVGLSQDGTRLAMSSRDGNIQIENVSTAVTEQILNSKTTLGLNFLFLKSGRRLITHYYSSIGFWNLDSSSNVYKIDSSTERISTILFSPDGAYFASHAENNEVIVWDVASAKMVWSFCNNDDNGYVIAFSPTSLFLATCTEQGVELWNITTKSLQICLPIPKSSSLEAVRFLPNETQLMIFDQDRGLSFWNILTGDRLNNFPDDMHPGACVADIFSNGRLLATGDKQGTVRIWDLSSSMLLHTFHMGQDWSEHYLEFSPNGEFIVYNTEKELVLWNINTGRINWSIPKRGWVVSFSDDGKKMLYGLSGSGKNITFCIRDTATGELLESIDIAQYGGRARLSKNEQYIETRCGTVSRNLQDSSWLKHVFFSGNWLTVNGENMLWLPSPYRPTAADSHRGKIALGFASGEVILYDAISRSFQSLTPAKTEVESTSCCSQGSVT